MSPELRLLLDQAKARVDAMTDSERQEMYEAQRLSWMRSCRNYRSGDRETVMVVLPAAEAGLVFQPTPAAPEPDYKAILVGLCAHLYLAEGQGDVGEDVWRALKLAGINPPPEINNDSDLSDWLGIEHDAESIWVLLAPGEVR